MLGGRPFGTSDDETPDPGITGLTGGVTAGPGTGVVTAVVTPVDLDDLIRSRCAALTGMQQFSYWSDPFLVPPGTTGSHWRGLNYPAATPYAPINSVPGGVWQMVSNAGFLAAVIDPLGGYPFIPAGGPSFIGPVDGATLGYCFARFKIHTGVPYDPTEHQFMIGWVDPKTLKVAGVGAGIGQTFFGGVGGTVASAGAMTGIPTAVPIDSAWHSMELFRRVGADTVKRWWVCVDGGAFVDVGACVDAAFDLGTPLMQVGANGVSQPTIWIDHVAYAADANTAAMSPSPTPPGG
jgi:hypothetical protein